MISYHLPVLPLVESDHDYRLVAFRTPANDCYAEKLVVLAFPNLTDERHDVVGQLVISRENDGFIGRAADWIEVHPDHRRKGVAKRLWLAAESLLGRSIEHDPVTEDGEAFASAMEAAAGGGEATGGEGREA